MLPFLVLHIIALLFWCAAQLYLPVLIAAGYSGSPLLAPPPGRGSMARFIFTNISTPAAILAIFAGTMIFLLDRTIEVWLIIKLTLVAALTITHALTGWLLLRVDHEPDKPVLLWCWSLGAAFLVLMTAIIWIVLAKPYSGLIQ